MPDRSAKGSKEWTRTKGKERRRKASFPEHMDETATMQTYSVKRIGSQRGGRRIWLEGSRLEKAGFSPQRRYHVDIDRRTRTMVLRVANDGDRLVTRKQRGGRTFPIIDLCNGAHLAMFEGLEQVRVVFSDGSLRISPVASDQRRLDRMARLRDRMATGAPIEVGSVSTGVGVLSLAIHQGLSDAGIASRTAFVCDIDGGYLQQCEEANPCFDRDTVVVDAPMQEIAHDHAALADLPSIDILEAGIPCTAHSSAGRAKKGLAMPEDDPAVGHLAAAFLAITAALNPAVVLVENVPNYMTSASFSILSNQLTEWGYEVTSTVISGADHNVIEHRERMALVAVTKGIDFDPADIRRPAPRDRRLGDILDDVPSDDPSWSSMDYLREKEERDLEAGKGFRMQIFDGNSSRVSTIGRGYAKVRSTEPKIAHPDKPGLLRQLTPAEHARCKGIPEGLVKDMPITRAHEVLGQSVLFDPFRAVGAAIGRSLGEVRPVEVQEFRLVA